MRSAITHRLFSAGPWYADFYSANHPAGALDLTARILSQFHDQVNETGSTAIVAVLPTIQDIDFYLSEGVWPYQPLLDRVAQAGIPIVDLGPLLLEDIGQTDPCDHFCTNPRSRTGHYTEAGNKLLATVMRDDVLANLLVSKASPVRP